MASQRWRELAEVDRFQFQEWLRMETNLRRDKGRAKYRPPLEFPPMFKGDPLDQAIEEALDLVFYLWMAKREQSGQNAP